MKRNLVASEVNRSGNLNQIYQNINCELDFGDVLSSFDPMLSIFSLHPGGIVLKIKPFHE